MTVGDTHRFLYHESPQTEERRIWVMHGKKADITADLFFHNLYHGCIPLRQTLQYWARDGGLELCLWLSRDGTLDFSGNADPQAARDRFENNRTRRAPKYGGQPAPSAATGASPAAAPAETEARAQNAAEEARGAAGGRGQGVENLFTKLTQVLESGIPTLLLVEDFPSLYEALSSDQNTLHAARSLRETVSKSWPSRVSGTSLVVFLTHHPEDHAFFERLLPPTEMASVRYREIGGPKPTEIAAMLGRMEMRGKFRVANAGSISTHLSRLESLRNATGAVRKVVKQGKTQLDINDFLALPPPNETARQAVLKEINALEGLESLKAGLKGLEKYAAEMRRSLEEGREPPDTPLHMIFTGRPGTGKTTVARLIARYLHSIGLLRRDSINEVSSPNIMSSFVRETGEKMTKAVEDARGGLLFIDEAHQFGDKTSERKREAVEALVPLAWNYRQEMVIVLAGYGMDDFLAMDEGLPGRFPAHLRFHFSDYPVPILERIVGKELAGRGLAVSEPKVSAQLRRVLQKRAARSTFANARDAKLLADEIAQRRAGNAASGNSDSSNGGGQVTLADLPPLVRRNDEVYQKAMSELEKMVGLESVRDHIVKHLNGIAYQMEEIEAGRSNEMRLHPGNMLFLGPPGTGKTTVARHMGELLYGMGCVDEARFVEAGRDNLVGRHLGDTARDTVAVIEKARDGVFFLDEAYSLQNGPQDQYGKEAIDTLVKHITMDDNAGTVFILAGYEADMMRFLGANAGLNRRFDQRIYFPNFPPEACMELARREMTKREFMWENGVLEAIGRAAEITAYRDGERFGNAGWVKGFVERLVKQMQMRVRRDNIPVEDAENRRLITLGDLGEWAQSGVMANEKVDH